MKMYVLTRMNEITNPITKETKSWKEYFVGGDDCYTSWSANVKEAKKFSENSFNLIKSMAKMYHCEYEELSLQMNK